MKRSRNVCCAPQIPSAIRVHEEVLTITKEDGRQGDMTEVDNYYRQEHDLRY